jgi:uncharacterized protein (DUF2164 family)
VLSRQNYFLEIAKSEFAIFLPSRYETCKQLNGVQGMRNVNAIKITKEIRADMIAAIKNYFLKEREEEIGDLAAGILLDFIIKELAPEFYNQGVFDSHKYMEDMIGDLLSIQK